MLSPIMSTRNHASTSSTVVSAPLHDPLPLLSSLESMADSRAAPQLCSLQNFLSSLDGAEGADGGQKMQVPPYGEQQMLNSDVTMIDPNLLYETSLNISG